MKTILFIPFLILLLCIGCTNTSVNESIEQNAANETPEALNDKLISSELLSYGRRSYGDIVEELYKEAVSKNSELNKLDTKIREIPRRKNDSLANYRDYSHTLQDYWSSVYGIINTIHDTILRKSTKEIFGNLEQKYKADMLKYRQKAKEADSLSIILNDQYILIKLLVTEPMIKRYITNEKPEIDPMENIINEYNKLIRESQEYVKQIE